MKWQVSWSKAKYDYKRLICDYLEGRHTGFVTNSKGMAKMVVLPQIGDEVFVSCDKKKILKCMVASEFVVNEQYGSYDEYSIGEHGTHPHTHNNTFLMLQIVEVYENPEPLKGFQRTWVKL
jgi:TATA-binding protein-associated factor Taf7